jgi:hypothetical protein
MGHATYAVECCQCVIGVGSRVPANTFLAPLSEYSQWKLFRWQHLSVLELGQGTLSAYSVYQSARWRLEQFTFIEALDELCLQEVQSKDGFCFIFCVFLGKIGHSTGTFEPSLLKLNTYNITIVNYCHISPVTSHIL